ncbi:MAG: homoserine dehydrogenase, partial [Sciscionella sp.]
MSKPRRSTIRVALLGCGTVGTEVARILTEHSAELTARIGAPIELVGVAVRRLNKPRTVHEHLLTTDAKALIAADVDVVVEVIGGIEPARSWLLAALRRGVSVVTANKA